MLHNINCIKHVDDKPVSQSVSHSVNQSKKSYSVVNVVSHKEIETQNTQHYESVKHNYQELIRRWDSERELLYDDNIHVEASAYAHWTDLLISTFYYKYLW